MRTLKKSLALVLALVMVLGLGVIGASADNALDNYTDASEIGDAYYEAVGVLTGLGIIDGMTETTIEPTGTYTREQAAKIIATMVLGVKNAESLTCVKAPFDDVPADRWSAGYIAFCVEQGIIDGMTDTTFEPTGTLTGFQWAKMLLAAVGFGANGEFTGTSWSLNTARVAHEAGLFTGDLSGAGHVNLSRQQAALYAFNTLTEIKQVSYSANNDNYIYGLQGYDWFKGHGSWWADGTGHTLGETVFDLTNVEGIVWGNEGTGEEKTMLYYVDGEEGENAEVSADTGLDVLQHAVRIWYIVDKAKTGVFTYDLATSTEYECGTIGTDGADAIEDLEKAGNIVADADCGLGDTDYVMSVIDNSAYVDDYYVALTFKVDMGTIGRTDETSGKTTLTVDSKRGSYKTDYFMTDISDMEIGDDVIVLVPNANYKAIYVAAVGATSGNVVDYTAKNGAIELSDGTVLYPSNLFAKYGDEDELEEMIDALDSKDHVKPAYNFVLDTHGHYIDLDNESLMEVSYFTGTYKHDEDWGSWRGEELVSGQFVNIETGEEFTAPVTYDWAKEYYGEEGYYDITSSLYGDETYSPEPIDSSNNVYGGQYVVLESAVGTWIDLKITATNNNIWGINKSNNVRFNLDNVKFVVVDESGSKLESDTYTGVDELISAYETKLGVDLTTVNLTRAIAVVEEGPNGNLYATTIFAFNDASAAAGGYAFFPTAIDTGATGGWHVRDNYYYYDFAYLNGAKNETEIKVDDASALTVTKPGFYAYTIDLDNHGYFTLSRVTNIVVEDAAVEVEFDGTEYYVPNGNQGRYSLTDETVVVDLTEDDDPITSVDDLMDRALNDEKKVTFVFIGDAKPDELKDVPYIYVVADEEDIAAAAEVTVKNSSTLKFDAVDPIEVSAYVPETVTIELVAADGTTWSATSGTLNIKVDGTAKALVWGTDVKVSTDKTIASFTLTVDGETEVEIVSFTA